MAKTAIQEEQGVSSDIFRLANFETARYRFYFFVADKAVRNVLDAWNADCINPYPFINTLQYAERVIEARVTNRQLSRKDKIIRARAFA